MRKRPTRRALPLNILGHPWAVLWRAPSRMPHGTVGYCQPVAKQILVADGQHPFEEKDTALHEVLHAILACQGGHSTGSRVEERYVRALATGLVGVLQDNPEFAQWLVEPINDPYESKYGD